MPELDHLRLYAAMMILFFHLLGSNKIINYLHLDTGVPLFFTLSGFLFFVIARTNEKEINYWKFIYNRFLRIYPMIIFLFFISIVLMKKFTAIDYLNLFGLNFSNTEKVSWIAGDWGYQYLSFNWWTVGIEFIFYLIFPFLYKFYKLYGLRFLVQCLLLILLFRYGLYYSMIAEYGWEKLSILLNYSVFGNFDIFIVGMIAGHFFIKYKNSHVFIRLFGSKILCVIYIACMWFFLIYCINYFDPTSYPTIIGILCSFMIIFYVSSFASIQSSLFSKTIAFLGSLSFSVYLLHSFVKDALVFINIEGWVSSYFNISLTTSAFLTCLLIYIPIIFIVSYLTYKTIEEPFLNMRVKYFR
ncbi:acyltransferase family protein [Cysteiniphilum halobium]|uniref:acyltransferase family protein n=1 Tax=Cysteiniphilum halobium TaxID=2219059 RepID=UPI0013C310C5|nr:acyltransferase [Cysteiniphilum halobium]